MSLLGTRAQPQGYGYLLESARMAKAYHALEPYPKFGFRKWKTESRGPLPRCAPFVRQIVKKGAFWLFGKPLTLTVDGDDSGAVAEWLNESWSANRMPGRSLAMAENGACSGAVVLKGSWDQAGVDAGSRTHPLRIDVLDAVEQCRLYYDPHDSSKLLMGRVQYPVFDYEIQKWVTFREDWTAESHVVYVPRAIPNASTPGEEPDFGIKGDIEGDYEVEMEEPNVLGVVPMVQVKNIEAGYWHGVGDLWRLFPAIDNLNLTYDLAHKDNQLSVYPKKVFIDLEQEGDEAPVEDGPGAEEHLKTSSEAKTQGKVEYLEATGAIREHLVAFAEEWKAQIYECAGGVDIRPDSVTNKGNLTRQVMELLHQPLLEATDAKRQSYGEDGVCKFYETMLTGLANAGLYADGKGKDVSVEWPPYFEPGEDELAVKTTRLVSAVQAGLTTQERAATSLAMDEGCTDVEELLGELPEMPEPGTAENQPEGNTNADRIKGKAKSGRKR